MRFHFHCRPSSMPPYSLCKKGSQCKPRHNLNIRLSLNSFYCRKYNYWIRRLVFLDKISTPKKGIYVWKPKQMKVAFHVSNQKFGIPKHRSIQSETQIWQAKWSKRFTLFPKSNKQHKGGSKLIHFLFGSWGSQWSRSTYAISACHN